MKRLPLIILILLIIPVSPRISDRVSMLSTRRESSDLDFVGTNYSLLIKPAFGQEQAFDFNRAYDDYIYTYDVYRSAHKEYIITKQAYLNYKTLTSKNEALIKTSEMLKLRNEVVRTYLTTLRMKLAETTGISNYEQNILYLRLDDEVSWFSEHDESLKSAGSLDDLVISAKEAQDKYTRTEVLIYRTLGTILAGKESTLREEISQQIETFKGKLAEIRQRGDKDTTVLERWLLEAENRLTRSQEKQFASQQILAKMVPGPNRANIYHQAQYTLEEAHQYLKEANFYLKEVVEEVKRAD